ncbi:MAG: flagellar basal body L-ring protein FlgH [bacterium]|nr:flagellar basal body L-ring protein FlgH [bacterium]
MMKRIVMGLLMVLGTAIGVDAQGLFGDASADLFQDRKPRRASEIGDILTILITETTSATNSANLTTNKKNTTSINSQKGTGPLRFIPGFGLTSAATTEYSGDASTARSQQIRARISVTVVGKKPNGDLIVEGNRVIEVNGEREVIYMTGAVNPKIIPSSNTIESFRMSDLQISYKGKGVVNEGTRPGIFVRIINWIF